MIKRYVVVSILLFAGLLPAGNAGAKALPLVDLDCGDEVTKSLRLESPVLLCTSSTGGLTITKSNVTLDLNGFGLVGQPVINTPNTAITVADGAHNVTIRNGYISIWDIRAVDANDNDNLRLEDLLITKTAIGLDLFGSKGTVDNVVFSDVGLAGAYMGGDGNRLVNSVFHDVGDGSEDAAFVQGDGAVVDNNVVVDSDDLRVDGADARVTNNDVLDAGLIVKGPNSRVTGNDIARDGVLSVDADGGKTTVSDNTSHDGVAAGILISDATKIVAKHNYAYAVPTPCSPSTACNQTESSLPLVTLGCGGEVTKSMRLAADVGPCTDGGIKITKSNVTLDLNHHHIIGNDADENPSAGLDTGVAMSSVKKVTVRNGYISGFQEGIGGIGEAFKVINVYVRDTEGAIFLGGDGRHQVRNVTASDIEQGTFSIGGITVGGDKSRIIDAIVWDVPGLSAIEFGSSKGKIDDSTTVDAHSGFTLFSSQDGASNNTAVGTTIGFRSGFEKSKMRSNTAIDASQAGFFIESGPGPKLVDNQAYVSERGFALNCAKKFTFKKNRSLLNTNADQLPDDSCP